MSETEIVAIAIDGVIRKFRLTSSQKERLLKGEICFQNCFN
jgi:hypothetical protein